MTNSSVPAALSGSDYVIVGLAHCFTKQDGNLVPVKILEPIPSAYFEALLKGVPTSYQYLYSLQLKKILEDERPTANHLPEDVKGAQFCEGFVERVMAAARTYQLKTDIQTQLPCGQTMTDVNFSTERKRILNASNRVSTEDNVKQHKYTHMTL
ncbi:MAG: hypothetical protein AAGA83_05245 [Cyanobacteria bacterium P01_F01_bin.116]